MDYETGLMAAFLVWLYSAIRLPVMLNSRLEKNLNRAGLRQSWLTLQPQSASYDELHRPWYRSLGKYLLVIGAGLPMVLTSWLSVAIFIGTYVYRTSKDIGAPAAVKEFRWRLRNTDMTLDQILQGLMQTTLQNNGDLDGAKEAWRADMRERGFA